LAAFWTCSDWAWTSARESTIDSPMPYVSSLMAVPLLSAADRLPRRPSRVVVGGTSGSGKTTLARRIGATIGASHTEIDSLHHGPGWTVRPEFLADVAALAAGQRWVTEYQYPDARPLLLARSDLVVYLLLPRWLVISRVVRRTLGRSLRREVLWNGNREPPLWTFLTDRDHVVRAAWRSHGRNATRIKTIRAALGAPRGMISRSGAGHAVVVDLGPAARSRRAQMGRYRVLSSANMWARAQGVSPAMVVWRFRKREQRG
jgi:adenylate kinase family enzyme